MTQVFDLEKGSISKTLSSEKMTLSNNDFLIHYHLLDPSEVVITLAFHVWFQHHPGVLAGGNA